MERMHRWTLGTKTAGGALLALLATAACDPAAEPLALAGPGEPLRSGNPHAEAEIFAPGVISRAGAQSRIAFAPDGEIAYFGDTYCDAVGCRLAVHVSHRTGGGWSEPVVASFSGGPWFEFDPFVTPDGSRLYYASTRRVNGVAQGWDVWFVERTAEGWGDPTNAGPAVNSRWNELYPSVDAAGTFYVGSDRPGGLGGWDIYRAAPADGGFAPLENLGAPVNSAAWEFNPQVSPDGRRLLMGSMNRATNVGEPSSPDIYVSHLHRGHWTAPQNVGAPVNTADAEYHPTVSPDGRTFFFVRNVAALNDADFYFIPVSLGTALRPGGSLGGSD